jgi:uncharacterized membrane protein SpoIIM required for sporulation
MTPAAFEKQITPRWQRLERLIEAAEKKKGDAEVVELPEAFREVSHDLSVAQHRMSPQRTVQRLNELVIRGYRVLERRTAGGMDSFFTMLFVTFPQLVRAEWRLVAWCSAVTYLPFLLLLFLTPHYPEWAMALLGPDTMEEAERVFGEGADVISELRGEFSSDFHMFCYYIWNNVSIDFRCFASGLAGGVGALLLLIFNGVHLGAFAGYIWYAGDPSNFWLWVCGHGPMEMTGMVLSGVAGVRLGLSVLKPGRMLRREALVLAGRRALPMIVGAAMMTCLAAVIEGFWSPQPFSPLIKHTFGAIQWLILIVFFLLAGRKAASTHAA